MMMMIKALQELYNSWEVHIRHTHIVVVSRDKWCGGVRSDDEGESRRQNGKGGFRGITLQWNNVNLTKSGRSRAGQWVVGCIGGWT